METAQLLSQAKQAANPSRYQMVASQNEANPPTSSSSNNNNASKSADSAPTRRSSSKSHKRKRPISSRDDIFRSRKLGPTSGRGKTGCDGNCMNPISKFLSNHQGFANALCFATPVRDSEELEEALVEDDHTTNNGGHNNNDNASLASDANTLNTCEDSMLMLDHKLAQMSKNQPPMPLFHDFKVNQNEPEGLRRIVETDTHSSSNLMKAWLESTQHQDGNGGGGGGGIVVQTSSSGSSDGANRGRARLRYQQAPPHPVIPEDEGSPPPMKQASTSSSSERSSHSHASGQIGEI